MPTCTLTSSSIIVPTGSPLISRMRSPTWMAFRTSGLISIPRTLRVEDFLWVHQRKRLDWWTGPTPPGTGSAGVIYYHNSTMTNPLAVIKILKRCLTDTRVIKTNNVKKKKKQDCGYKFKTSLTTNQQLHLHNMLLRVFTSVSTARTKMVLGQIPVLFAWIWTHCLRKWGTIKKTDPFGTN